MNPAMLPGMGFTNCDGLKFYAFPAAAWKLEGYVLLNIVQDHMPHQTNQGWGMVMSPEMAPKAADWGNFQHFGSFERSFEPEMPETLKAGRRTTETTGSHKKNARGLCREGPGLPGLLGLARPDPRLQQCRASRAFSSLKSRYLLHYVLALYHITSYCMMLLYALYMILHDIN